MHNASDVGIIIHMMRETHKRSDCPISCGLDIFGDKWSLLIIRDLVLKKKATYGELLESNEKIATNILAKKLNTLVKNKIIKKTKNPNDKRSVLYTLTKKGSDLIPILKEIILWNAKHDRKTIASKEFIAEVKKIAKIHMES